MVIIVVQEVFAPARKLVMQKKSILKLSRKTLPAYVAKYVQIRN